MPKNCSEMIDWPKISVIVITYNQEDVIARTLDSLLGQECLYEICVSDDCSSDRTWEILQDYSRRNPGLFKLNRNNPNIGIFANEEQTWTMPSGDLVYRIAGDDECPKGYFASVISFMRTKGLDWKHDIFAVVGDCRTVYPDGSWKMCRSKTVERGFSPVKLKLRELMNDRSACFSRAVLDSYVPVSRGRSYVVEAAQDIQLEIFCPRFYYIPECGNIYYAELGVSARLDDELKQQRTDVFKFLEDFLNGQGIRLDRFDVNYVKFKTEYLKSGVDHSFLTFMKAVWYFLLSIDPSLGFEGLEFSRLFNSVKRKLVRR